MRPNESKRLVGYEEGSQGPSPVLRTSKDKDMSIMEPRMTKISIRTEVEQAIKQATRRVMESELPLDHAARYIANLAAAQKVFNEALDQLFTALEKPPIDRPASDDAQEHNR